MHEAAAQIMAVQTPRMPSARGGGVLLRSELVEQNEALVGQRMTTRTTPGHHNVIPGSATVAGRRTHACMSVRPTGRKQNPKV